MNTDYQPQLVSHPALACLASSQGLRALLAWGPPWESHGCRGVRSERLRMFVSWPHPYSSAFLPPLPQQISGAGEEKLKEQVVKFLASDLSGDVHKSLSEKR